ncbi:MAG: AAA family ATPase [Clostridium sp.]|uniref:ATP-dependent DNA helicase n=1 Tax=Clostridium TaxID=1485 RepID=UPI0012B74F79|nr:MULTISPECIES: AAA family ATPase [Clostridium]MBS6889677.1 AAA family ATPase [Clostridium sp.]
MLKFTVVTVNKVDKLYKISAYMYKTNYYIEKIILSENAFNFKEGNSYLCNIEKEGNEYLYIKEVKQIDIDINIFQESIKILNKYIDIDDLKSFLLFELLEDMIKKVKEYKYKNEKLVLRHLTYFYNKNNLVKLLNNYNINIKSQEVQATIEYILNNYKELDILKLFEEKSFLLEYYFRLDLKSIVLINKKQSKLCKIIFCLDLIEREGNTFAYLKQLEKQLIDIGYKEINKLRDDLSYLEKEEVLKVIDEKIYFIDNYKDEINIINNIKDRISLNSIEKIDTKIIENQLKSISFNLDKEQTSAIYKALENNITLITGGAGTGKTTIINILINIINKFDFNNKVEVVSLTGKAVNVINSKLTNESIKARTIHKLFGIQGDIRFRNIDKSIKLDYLIIDEVSMLDIKLLSFILRVIPIDTKLILVGDINQAEPIGIGSPINDIIKSGIIEVTRLKNNNRSKSDVIRKNSQKILENNNVLEYKNNEFEVIKCKNNIDSLLKKIEDLNKENIPLKDISILSFQNYNVQKINEKISQNYLKELREGRKYTVNDKVIQLKNDNRREIYNGEQGIVAMIIEDMDNTEVYVDFGDKIINYDKYTINQIELAYAITIHKAQGSQNKAIIIVIDKNDEDYLNRNLLYTAITRAEERCIIIQENNVFNECICKRPKEKNSMIYDELVKLT